MHLAARLDRLVAAFEAHGLDVGANLLPGATAAQIDAVEAELGVRLPRAYRELYGWSAGCVDPASDVALMFRDNTFLRLDDVAEVRRAVVATYGATDDEDAENYYGVDLRTTAPFAEFMGSTYLVATGPHRLDPTLAHPVIGAFQGVETYFHSIETMVETCIEWVEHPDYEPLASAPDETATWLKHNPGLFGPA